MFERFLVFSVCLLCFGQRVTSQSGSTQEHLPPIVLIPGNGGSQLEARTHHVDGVTSPINNCPEKPDWFTIWANFYELTPG